MMPRTNCPFFGQAVSGILLFFKHLWLSWQTWRRDKTCQSPIALPVIFAITETWQLAPTNQPGGHHATPPLFHAA
ncbi:hypothetical protein [Rugamonas fusca]|uniref:hypothetical protein n=1 Tax=Rugamonas fusca TaxID=2758568 RepID=UPI0015F51EFC|nr:hypothetical protein [Rugamonas fusca]